MQRSRILKREGKLDRETAHRQVKYLNNVIEADHGKLKILIKAGARFQIDPHGLCHDQGILKSCEPCASDRLAPGACSPASGARCALWRELWHWALGADGGHGHAQPPFRSSRLIGAERQPTSDCRQSLQQSPPWGLLGDGGGSQPAIPGYESASRFAISCLLSMSNSCDVISPCSCCYTNFVQLIRHTAPHHLRWPGCLLGALAEYRLDPGHPHRHNLTGVIHCQRIGPVL